jgi:hypothetical protein
LFLVVRLSLGFTGLLSHKSHCCHFISFVLTRFS